MGETIDSRVENALPQAEIQALRGVGTPGGVRPDERLHGEPVQQRVIMRRRVRRGEHLVRHGVQNR